MDNFGKALRHYHYPTGCLDCDDFRWCPHKVWVGEPKDCPSPKEETVLDNLKRQ